MFGRVWVTIFLSDNSGPVIEMSVVVSMGGFQIEIWLISYDSYDMGHLVCTLWISIYNLTSFLKTILRISVQNGTEHNSTYADGWSYIGCKAFSERRDLVMLRNLNFFSVYTLIELLLTMKNYLWSHIIHLLLNHTVHLIFKTVQPELFDWVLQISRNLKWHRDN